MKADSVGSTGGGGGGGAEDYILIRDEKSNGTPGGTFTSGAWRTRDLTVEVSDTGGHASISSNQITLAAGTYKVKAHAPAFQVTWHKTKLRNITDASDIVIGTSELSTSPGADQCRSFLEGRFTIAAPKVIELQHYSSSSQATQGLGQPTSIGVIEVYSVIEFWKEA